MWDSRLAQRARLNPSGVLSVLEPSGYPASIRCQVHLDDAREAIDLTDLPPYASAWRGPACLLFHRHNERLEDQYQLLIRGTLVEEGGRMSLRPAAFVTANGRRDTDRMPHAGAPLHLLQFMLLGQKQARAYLRRRGMAWPKIQFAPLLRALDEPVDR
jgi:hypothetical protein